MLKFAEGYYNDLLNFANSIRVTGPDGALLTFPRGIEAIVTLVKQQARLNRKVMFIGNGGSAAVSSHMAIDIWKNGGVRAIAFNDGAMLTCLGNDYGYKHTFGKPIEMFADPGDVLIAISSSGRSENILNGVQAARSKECRIATLSGFDADNPLSSSGEINFYVPSNSYGYVEVIHHSICHCMIDILVKMKNGQI